MALDKLVGMTVFRRAVELGSLAAAARALELSPEMAGQHLKALEERLGVRLLKRTTRRLSLTDVGRAYHDRCIAALDEIALAEAEAVPDRPSQAVSCASPRPWRSGPRCSRPPLPLSLTSTLASQLKLTSRNERSTSSRKTSIWRFDLANSHPPA